MSLDSKVSQYFFLFDIRDYLKNLLICSNFWNKKELCFRKKPKS